MDFILALGTTSLADALSLDDPDGGRYRIPLNAVQGSGGGSIPGGVNFGVHQRGLHATSVGALHASDSALVPIKASLLVTGASVAAMATNYRAVQRKLEQALKAFGADNQGDRVCLWYRPVGVANYVYYDVGEGNLTWVDLGQPDGDVWMACLLELWCLPYGRGAALSDSASSTITDGAVGSTIYRAGVPGSVEAALRLQVKSVGSSYIQRLRVGRRSGNGQPLAASDFTPRYLLTALSPGTSHVDTTAMDGGHSPRITASATAWQNLGYARVAAGARQYGVFDLFARCKDSTTPLIAPTWQTVNPVVASAPTISAPTHIGHTSGSFSGTSGSTSLTLSAGAPVGALVVVRVGGYAAGKTAAGVASGSDTRGNTWIGVGWGGNTNGQGAVFIYAYLTTALQTGDTITFAATGLPSATWTTYLAADYWTGTANIPSPGGNGSAGNSTSPDGGSNTTMQTGDLIVQCTLATVNATYSAGSGFTALTGIAYDGTNVFGGEYEIAGYPGSYSSPATLSAGGQWGAVSIVFHPGGTLVEGEYLLLLTSYDSAGHESFPTSAQAVTVPVTGTTFADDFETGDVSKWTTPAYRYFAGSGNMGAVRASTSASLVSGVPDQLYGLLCDAGINANSGVSGMTANDFGGAWTEHAIAGAGTDGYLRLLLKPAAFVGTGTAGVVLLTDANHVPLIRITNLNTGGNIAVYNGGGTDTATGATYSTSNINLGIDFGPTADATRIEVYWKYLANSLAQNFVQIQSVRINETTVLSTPFPATTANATAPTPTTIALGAFVASNSVADNNASALTLYLDSYQQSASPIGANTGALAISINAGSGQSGYYLYVQRLGDTELSGIHRVDLGNVTSYTLTTLGTTPAKPPTSAPPVQNGLYRCRFGTYTSDLTTAVLTTLPAYSSRKGASIWERLYLGTVVLPPQVIKEGDSAPPDWVVVIQGMSGGTNTPTLDCDSFRLYPHRDEDFLEVAWPQASPLTQHALFVIDSRYDGRVSCEVLTADGSAVLGSITAQGQMTLGPGDNLLTVEADYGSGGFYCSDVTGNVQFQVQLAQITPRYPFGEAAVA